MSDELIKQAAAQYRAGEMESARQVLKSVLKDEPKNEKAWLWFLQTFESIDGKLKVVDLWLKVDPQNQNAQRVLEKVSLQQKEKLVLDYPLEPEKPEFTQTAQPIHLPAQKERPQVKRPARKRNRAGLIFGIIIAFLLIAFGALFLVDMVFDTNILSRQPECNCADTDAYMLRLQDRIERWKVNRMIIAFAQLQGDNSQIIITMQGIYQEEMNDPVPECLLDVHTFFLELIEFNIKYLQAVEAKDEFSMNKYELSIEIKLEELQNELVRITNEFECTHE